LDHGDLMSFILRIFKEKKENMLIFFQDLNIKGIPTGNSMHLMVLDASCLLMGEVTCIMKNDSANWQAVLQKVTNYCETLSAKDFYKPR